MAINIVQETTEALPEYGKVSMAFLVRSRLAVEVLDGGLRGWRLTEEKLEPPYEKDYDSVPGERPARWLRRWDIGHWGVFSAFDGRARVGGAVVAWKTPGAHMLEGRDDLAVLWDMRVHTEYRRRGVGSRLFRRAVDWAREKGCVSLKIETQNINVPACRFYASQGCELWAIYPRAYPELPEEVQLLWYLDLRQERPDQAGGSHGQDA